LAFCLACVVEQGADLAVDPFQRGYQGRRLRLDLLGRRRFDSFLCGAFEIIVAVPDKMAAFFESHTIFTVPRHLADARKSKVDDRLLPLAHLFRVDTRQAGRIEIARDKTAGNILARVVDHGRRFGTFLPAVGLGR